MIFLFYLCYQNNKNFIGMKIKFFTVILLIFTVFFSSCERDMDKIITMKVEPKLATKDSPIINLIIENQTNKRFSYGKAFSLEYFDNGNWINIPFEDFVDENWINTHPCFNFTKELLVLESKDKKECPFNTSFFNNFGRYRIVKKFTHDKKEYIVYADFELK